MNDNEYDFLENISREEIIKGCEELFKDAEKISKEDESNILAHLIYRNGSSLEAHHDERMDKVFKFLFDEVAINIMIAIENKFHSENRPIKYEYALQTYKKTGCNYNMGWDKPTNLYYDILNEVPHNFYFNENVPEAYLAECITRYLFFGKVKEGIKAKWKLYDDKMKILNKDIHNRIFTLLYIIEEFGIDTARNFVLAY